MSINSRYLFTHFVISRADLLYLLSRSQQSIEDLKKKIAKSVKIIL